MQANLQFPEKDAIVLYLNLSSLTSHLEEKKYIEPVATCFANHKDVKESEVKLVVNYTIKVVEGIDLPNTTLNAIVLNLTQALIDCANGKKIELKKTTNNS